MSNFKKIANADLNLVTGGGPVVQAIVRSRLFPSAVVASVLALGSAAMAQGSR